MNIYEQEKYKDYKPAIKDTKTNNKEILNNIEIIKDAILKKKKISFDYYKNDIDEDNKLIEVKVEPKLPYIVSPYLLSFNLQKLYLYGLKDKEKDLHAYRLDRIKNIEILNTKVSNKYT
jgi:predicted DNA-binding transcriptional regulator YafY